MTVRFRQPLVGVTDSGHTTRALIAIPTTTPRPMMRIMTISNAAYGAPGNMPTSGKWLINAAVAPLITETAAAAPSRQ
jgi:hypothetical protein